MSRVPGGLALLLLTGACAGSGQRVRPNVDPAALPAPAPVAGSLRPDPKPMLPPEEAYRRGWMPLASTGVPGFLKAHPTYDGRGVLIGILDSGIDPGIPGMSVTSAGTPKILDLRDFSGEGNVALERATPAGDSIRVAGGWLRGFGRVRALNAAGPWYTGTLRELPLGEPPASDLNWNDRVDSLPIIVTRASDGWVLFTDTDGDGSLLGERPVHDYLVGRETFGWAPRGHAPPLNVAANFSDSGGVPALDLYFDTGAHGSHVAGIAAGHDLYGVKGFDGVAPGAQLLGLKIANNAQGGLSVTGSMLRAMDYAIRFAAARRIPLVLNMSFGVGNEIEGTARIDQLIDSVLALHPDIVFAISAGNDGPGLSTVGFPGSSLRALTVGASWPSAFASGPNTAPDTAPEPIAFFSSRGGELAKPDLLAPGRAYSGVPRWNIGDERKGGTSMASPHAAGLAAILVSALTQGGGSIEARRIKRAMMVTARPRPGQTYIDEGTGLADVSAAYRWLSAGHDAAEVAVRAESHGVNAAWRIHGLESPSDTLQAFTLLRPSGATSETFTLRSDAPWLLAPRTASLGAGATHLGLVYRASALREPGVYTGVVSGWGSDTLGGPAFRLVNTVIVPATKGQDVRLSPAHIPAGGQQRVFFTTEPDRPFAVVVETGAPSQQGQAFIYEPGGQPYRDENGIGAGYGEEAGVYQVDGRDVVPGVYEADAVAPENGDISAAVDVIQSPVAIGAHREGTGVVLTLRNGTPDTVTATPLLALVGGERTVKVVANGSAPERIPFVVPDWAVHAAIDVTMDPAQWSRFTDFGLTLYDSSGHQIGKSPLNYALGRLQVDLPDSERTHPVEVVLTPGFADTASTERWTANVSIRLYGDSSHVSTSRGEPAKLSAASTATSTLPLPSVPVVLGDAFFPLGIVVVNAGGHTWTHEIGLPEPTPPLAR